MKNVDLNANHSMAWIPLNDLIDLKKFKDQIDKDGVVIQDYSFTGNTFITYSTKDEELKKLVLELQSEKEKIRSFEIGLKRKEIEIQSLLSKVAMLEIRIENITIYKLIKQKLFKK